MAGVAGAADDVPDVVYRRGEGGQERGALGRVRVLQDEAEEGEQGGLGRVGHQVVAQGGPFLGPASCAYRRSSRVLVSGSWMWMEVAVPHFGRTAERLRLTTGRESPCAQVRAVTSRAKAAMMTATRT